MSLDIEVSNTVILTRSRKAFIKYDSLRRRVLIVTDERAKRGSKEINYVSLIKT